MHLVKPDCKVKSWGDEKGSKGEKFCSQIGFIDKWDFSAIEGWADLVRIMLESWLSQKDGCCGMILSVFTYNAISGFFFNSVVINITAFFFRNI